MNPAQEFADQIQNHLDLLRNYYKDENASRLLLESSINSFLEKCGLSDVWANRVKGLGLFDNQLNIDSEVYYQALVMFLSEKISKPEETLASTASAWTPEKRDQLVELYVIHQQKLAFAAQQNKNWQIKWKQRFEAQIKLANERAQGLIAEKAKTAPELHGADPQVAVYGAKLIVKAQVEKRAPSKEEVSKVFLQRQRIFQGLPVNISDSFYSVMVLLSQQEDLSLTDLPFPEDVATQAKVLAGTSTDIYVTLPEILTESDIQSIRASGAVPNQEILEGIRQIDYASQPDFEHPTPLILFIEGLALSEGNPIRFNDVLKKHGILLSDETHQVLLKHLQVSSYTNGVRHGRESKQPLTFPKGPSGMGGTTPGFEPAAPRLGGLGGFISTLLGVTEQRRITVSPTGGGIASDIASGLSFGLNSLSNIFGLGGNFFAPASAASAARVGTATLSNIRPWWARWEFWAIVIMAVFLFINSFQDFTNVALRGGGKALFSPVVNLAAGTCPVENGVIRTGVYNPTAKSGHGSAAYWQLSGSSLPEGFVAPYSIPIEGMYTAGCENPSACSFYGYAIDVVAPIGTTGTTPVRVPIVCPTGEPCENTDINWVVQSSFFNCAGGDVATEAECPAGSRWGWGAILNTNANGHSWRIYINHIDTQLTKDQVYNTSAENGVGNFYTAGDLSTPHVHIELNMDEAPLPPTFLCDGSSVIGSGGNICSPPSNGYCSVSNLTQYFGDAATNMANICMRESKGLPDKTNKNCLTGASFDYSIGLFQINLLGHPGVPELMPAGLRERLNAVGFTGLSCPDGFTKQNRNCSIISGRQELVNVCESWFLEPANNTAYAVSLFNYYKDLKKDPYTAWVAPPVCGNP